MQINPNNALKSLSNYSICAIIFARLSTNDLPPFFMPLLKRVFSRRIRIDIPKKLCYSLIYYIVLLYDVG